MSFAKVIQLNSLFALPPSVVDELRPYWRRRHIVIAFAWLVCLFGWLSIAFLPDRYESMTRIYIETENLLTPLLRNIAVQADMQRQLEVLQRTLLNHTNMAKVAHATDMDLDAQTDLDRERLYDGLAHRIVLRSEGQNLFLVSYSSGDPQQAKRVVETLLNIFVETNLGQNRTSMDNAQTFLENQIAQYEMKLKQVDQRLADYKGQHLDVLTGDGGNFSARIEAARQAENLAQGKYEDKVILREQLQATLQSTPQFIDTESQPQVVIAGAGGSPGSTGGSPWARVRQLRQELARLQSQYTDTHPDVIVAKRALASAEAELKTQEEDRKSGKEPDHQGGSPNPVYEQVKLRLIQTEGEVSQAQNQLQSAKTEVARLQALATSAPTVEADLADLTREYSVQKAKFEELLSRRESARISAAVEVSGDKLQFRVIEPPNVPSRPIFPNRPLLATLVLFVGFAVGGAVVFLLHKFDETVTSDGVLSSEFEITVLGNVTRGESAGQRLTRFQHARYFLIASAGLFGCYALFLAATQIYELSELTQRVHLPYFLKRLFDLV